MRTITTAQESVLASRQRATHLRVYVDNGTAHELTDLEERNWVKQVTYGGNVDSNVDTATVTLFQKVDDLNLSPLVDGSKINLNGTVIDVGNAITIDVAVVAEGLSPVSSDWMTVFEGEIERIGWADNKLTLSCLDKSGELVARFIETQVKYPADPATSDDVERIMQAILDTVYGTTTGANLAANTSFEDGDNGEWFKSGNWEIAADANARTGSLCARKAPGTNALLRNDTSSAGLIECRPGDTFRAVCWAKASGTTDGTCVVAIQWLDDALGSLSFSSGSTTALTTSYQELTVDGTAPASAAYCRLSILPGTVIATDTIYVDDVELRRTGVNAKHVLYSETGTAATPFRLTDSPGWVILEYIQKKEGVMNALMTLANQIGWTVRHKWNDDVGAFVLTLYRPNRAVAARGSYVFTGSPGEGTGTQIDGTTYVARSSPSTPTEFDRDGGAAAACAALHAAIMANQSSDLSAWIENDTTLVVEWGTPGDVGNSIPFTEAMANVSIDGGGTLGGTRPGYSPVSQRTFTPSDYHTIDGMGLGRELVRNRINVVYGRFQEDRTEVEVNDEASQIAYGIRYMQIAEDFSSQIDTESEARDMANAILNDIKDVLAEKQVTLPFFPWVEPADLYTFAANGRDYDTDQTLAVTSWRHTITGTRARTSLTCQGAPSGGIKRWLNLEAERVRAGVDRYSNDAPTGPGATAGVGTLIIDFDDPRGMSPPIKDWAFSKVYVSTVDGFTPSSSNLEYTGRATHVEIDGLVPGLTYYAKIQHVDDSGNVSATSTQVSMAVQKVGPYHENGEREGGPVNPNPNFSVYTFDETTNPPDAWTVDLGDWGTGAGEFYVETSELLSGNKALKWESANDLFGTKRIISDWFPVEGGALYRITPVAKSTTAPNNVNVMRIGWQLDDEDKNASPAFDGTVGLWDGATLILSSVWQTGQRGWVVTADTDRYMRLLIEIDDADGTQPDLYVDRIIVGRDLARLIAQPSSGTNRSASASSWTAPWLATAGFINQAFDNAGGWTPGNSPSTEHKYTVPFDGEYEITGGVRFLSVATGKYTAAKLRLNGVDLALGPVQAVQAISVGQAVVVWRGQLAEGDEITVFGIHDDTVSRAIDDSESFLFVQQVPERRE